MKIKNQMTGKSCKCGYVFSDVAAIRSRKLKSFAVVSDKSYQRFLKAELGVVQAGSEIAKSRAIARASAFVGSLIECPECGRFLLSPPGGDSEAVYFREDQS